MPSAGLALHLRIQSMDVFLQGQETPAELGRQELTELTGVLATQIQTT